MTTEEAQLRERVRKELYLAGVRVGIETCVDAAVRAFVPGGDFSEPSAKAAGPVIDREMWKSLREEILGQPCEQIETEVSIRKGWARVELDDLVGEAHAYVSTTMYQEGTIISIGHLHFLVNFDDVIVVKDPPKYPQSEWTVLYDSRAVQETEQLKETVRKYVDKGSIADADRQALLRAVGLADER